MKKLLLYADDPGGANYLSPLCPALRSAGYQYRFMVSPALSGYVQQRGMNASIRQAQTAEKLLEDIDLLLVGSSEDRNCFAHQLVDLANNRKIVSIGVVDMAVNAAQRFQGSSKDTLNHAPAWLAVPDESSRTSYIKLGYPPDRILVCGHPHYDVVRERRSFLQVEDRRQLRKKIYPDAPSDRPVWLFLGEGVDQLDPCQSFRSQDYTLEGRGDTDFRACIVLEELLDAATNIASQPWISLRPHPKNKLSDFSSVIAELGSINQGCDPLQAVWAADLVVGMTTMLLLETYLLQRPHLSIIPRRVELNWLPTLMQGLTPVATTREEIQSWLASIDSVQPVEGDILPSGAVHNILRLINKALSLESSHMC